MQTYLDFDLIIEKRGGEYAACARSPDGEEASHSFVLPFEEFELKCLIMEMGQRRRGSRRLDNIQTGAARELGGKLFGAVFSGEMLNCFRRSQEAAERRKQGMRLRLRLEDAPAIADLPWEFLLDTERDHFPAQSHLTPLVRYIEMPQIRPLSAKLPLRVLVAVANPEGTEKLDIEGELFRLDEALQPLIKAGKIQKEELRNASFLKLQRLLRNERFHVFHFIGHGGFDSNRDEGMLMLEDERGREVRADAQRIGTLLRDHLSLRLAVLNACESARVSPEDTFSGVATTLIRQGIPAVVAMQFEISDKAAVVFAEEFYTALTDGMPVDAALGEARKAIYFMPNDIEWGTPVLYMRSADGVLFDFDTDTPPVALPQGGNDEKSPFEGGAGDVSEGDVSATDTPPVALPQGGIPKSQSPPLNTDVGDLGAGDVSATDTSPVALPQGGIPKSQSPPLKGGRGDVFTNKLDMKFVLIPPGEFLMGPEDEPGRDHEKQHRVTISRAFYMQTTAVTQRQWKGLMGDNPSYFKENCPVEQVSWHDVQKFIKKLNKTEGADRYRLPTEAEWEYACRAGTTTAYCFGDDAGRLGEYAWYSGNSEERTHSVGQLKPNAWGLHDMHGNVWEWCQDWSGDYPSDTVTDPRGPPTGSSRVLRGGGWIDDAGRCRAAPRYRLSPDSRDYDLGLRLALSPGQQGR